MSKQYEEEECYSLCMYIAESKTLGSYQLMKDGTLNGSDAIQ